MVRSRMTRGARGSAGSEGEKRIVIVSMLAQVTCALRDAAAESAAFDRRMADRLTAAMDAGEPEQLDDALDMAGWIDERRLIAAASVMRN
jgi:hypothetical protein